MCAFTEKSVDDLNVHSWLKQVHISFVPGPSVTPLSEEVINKLLEQFRLMGHIVQDSPDNDTDIILTTTEFGEPIHWRKCLSLIGRMRFHYTHSPVIYTLVNAKPDDFERILNHFEAVLAKDELDPADYEFAGLAPEAYDVLYKQGKRGGAIMALERLVQAQAKGIHILLLVGDEKPQTIYHFDLVGGYPQSQATDGDAFYPDIVLRLVTTVSTHEITEHEVVGELVSHSTWDSLETPGAMHNAALKLGERDFFTEMVRIDDIVQVPAVQDAVASQYSEGCFATWDPTIEGLITTVTGSARPVDKGSITEDDLAIIVGIRPDGQGAQIRHVEGKRNDPPSSEAVEMIEMDISLPKIELSSGEDFAGVPVARSNLHGHRGISAYNPDLVEYVPLDPPYYNFPVTCATEAQARGIHQAFARSEALKNPDDPRQVVFTVLPTHGVVMAEKWVPGKVPFQVIWEYFDAGHLVVDPSVPQGVMDYSEESGSMVLES
ncbi:MAG: hypothetical protein KAI94_08000 [Anaerolineales bacterium]|nr:hypothetical protein [Anaerolineales bacterium]